MTRCSFFRALELIGRSFNYTLERKHGFALITPNVIFSFSIYCPSNLIALKNIKKAHHP